MVSHSLLGGEYGYAQGFEFYDESAVGGHDAITSERVTETARGWLRERSRDRPFFLMAHYFDPHFAYQHHRAYDRTSSYDGSLRPGMAIWDLRHARNQLTAADIAFLRGLYQEEIGYTDHQIGRLVGALEARRSPSAQPWSS